MHVSIPPGFVSHSLRAHRARVTNDTNYASIRSFHQSHPSSRRHRRVCTHPQSYEPKPPPAGVHDRYSRVASHLHLHRVTSRRIEHQRTALYSYCLYRAAASAPPSRPPTPISKRILRVRPRVRAVFVSVRSMFSVCSQT